MTDDLKDLEKEAEVTTKFVGVERTLLIISFYLAELGGWFSE